MKFRRALATWAVCTALALLINVPSSSASGTSITSPGAAAAVGVSDEAWLAFLAGHGELAGASAAAPVASAVATAAAATIGTTVASPGLVGRVTGLLGGIGKWFLGIGDPAQLPPGVAAFSQTRTWTNVPCGAWPGQFCGSGTMTVTNPRYTGSGGSQRVAVDVTYSYQTVDTYKRSVPYIKISGSNPAYYVWAKVNELGPSPVVASWPVTSVGAGPYTMSLGYYWGTYSDTGNGVFVGAQNVPVSFGVQPPTVPLRHIEQTVTCKTAAGVVTTQSYVGPSAVWPGSQLVEVAGLMCPTGSRAVGVTATVKTEGGSDVVVVNEPYVQGTGWDEVTADIPEPCYSGTTCTLELEKVTSPGTYARVDPESVPDWWSDPVRDQTYRCVYGAGATWVVLPIASCEVYKNPSAPTLSKPTGTGSDPSDPSGDCSFGWGDVLNGGIFVRGSKCVLRWAFIPTAGFAPVTARFKDGWSGSGIGTWVATTGGSGGTMGAALASAGAVGCMGPTYEVAIGGWDGTLRPFSTCSEPFATIAPLVKALLSVLLVFAGVRSIVRRITRAADLPNAPGA